MLMESAHVFVSLILFHIHRGGADKLGFGTRITLNRIVTSDEMESGSPENPSYSAVADQVERQGEYNLTKIYDIIHKFHKSRESRPDNKPATRHRAHAQLRKKSLAQAKAKKRQYEIIGKLDPGAPGQILPVGPDDHVADMIYGDAGDTNVQGAPVAQADDLENRITEFQIHLPFMPSLALNHYPGHYQPSEVEESNLNHNQGYDGQPIPIAASYAEFQEGTQHGGFSGEAKPNVFPAPLLQGFPQYLGHLHYYQTNPAHAFEALHAMKFETVHDHRTHVYPCQNGGVQVHIGGSTQCICRHGFIGTQCQDQDFCKPVPCANEGRCYNMPDLRHFRCDCKLGFYGELCTEKDPCYPNPCHNNGRCTHDGKRHTCICSSKFKGPHCKQIKSCFPNPCANFGKCIEKQTEGEFQCECVPPWRGQLCKEHSYCHSNPCQNGGTCREKDNGFDCICLSGWYGAVCAESACVPNRCFNGGSCMEERNGAFRCLCMPWHSGNLCEENRPCLTKPCMHDGKCIDAYSGYQWSFGPLQYYCLCKSPYVGLHCEQHACMDCHRNAHCDVDRCVCDDGYEGTGIVCRKISNLCHPNPCFNDGVCVETYAQQFEVQKRPCISGEACGFKCVCSRPFIPPLCRDKDPCEPNPCKNGYCILREGQSFECKCDEGYRGVHCDERDACKPNPCQHHGICRPVNGTPSCDCVGRWQGHLCKDCGCPRRSSPGIPDMSCNQAGDCVCPSGYAPDFKDGVCAKETKGHTSQCDLNPCLNGATCIDVSDTDFKCLCSSAFYGKFCQHQTRCNPNPCKNGGVCKEVDGKFMGCECPPGYLQPFCDKDTKGRAVCTPNPCTNQGLCVPNKGGFDCVCSPRYTGPHCEVDTCAHCDQHATCISGRCRCKPGFTGNGYECIKEDCPICPMHATCQLGGCVCDPGYVLTSGSCLPPEND